MAYVLLFNAVPVCFSSFIWLNIRPFVLYKFLIYMFSGFTHFVTSSELELLGRDTWLLFSWDLFFGQALGAN